MSEDIHQGYRDPGLAVLKKYDIAVWDRVEIETTKGLFTGLILPRSKTEDAEHIVIKMPSGYNTGVHVESITKIKRIGRREGHYSIPEKEFPYDKRKKNVTLLGTGGTIASRLDYTTGAVVPAFSPGELYGAVPELADICNLTTTKLFGVFSENMGPEQYVVLAKEIERLIREEDIDGIVIGHGTDTMHHTGSVLSYMIQNTPIPIVLVGSQRSSDRPSSDAARNLINAVYTAAHSDIAEIMVCMFGPTSDDYGLLHVGTRVRKMHSSYRSTFRTLSDVPIAMVWPDRYVPLREYKKRRKDKDVIVNPAYDDRVTILYYYPGMKPDVIDSLIDNGYRGIVIAGTGLGHVNSALNKSLKRAVDKGITVVMTVQTLWGYVHMNVYDVGRYLLELGVIPCENMLPEAAYMKLCWVLGQTQDQKEAKEMMLKTIAHEITEREPHNGYLVYQGGIPEVEKFLSTYKK
ncbi:MAG: Glu-tRNA(Gln) amidotransferase subunit GatD [Deltaproteobacteria bacterium]|nr:Glu-tRNA(Gln) amidotransferase subunit GatD [Deltaproteobacteria bacterium]